MKKKVLFVIRSFAAGGTEISLLNLIKSRDDMEPTVLALYGTGALREQFSQHANCIAVYDMAKKHLPGAGRMFNHFLKICPADMLHALLIKENYDVEVAYMNGLPAKLVSGARKDTQRCCWFHMGYPEDSTLKDVDLLFQSEKEIANIYNQFDYYICVTHAQAATLLRIASGAIYIHPGNLKVIHNVIDTDRIRALGEQPFTPPEIQNRPIFVCCARLEQEKGIDRLLQAAKTLKEEQYSFSIWIVGTGTAYSTYLSYIQENGLSGIVFLAGYQANPYPYMKNADIYVSPSRFEGYGLSIAEAMALQMPVISTACEGPSEIMADYHRGVLVENTQEGITTAMREMLRTMKTAYEKR